MVIDSWLSPREGQQLLVDSDRLRSVHPDVKLKAGMKPLLEIKILKADPASHRSDGPVNLTR